MNHPRARMEGRNGFITYTHCHLCTVLDPFPFSVNSQICNEEDNHKRQFVYSTSSMNRATTVEQHHQRSTPQVK